MDAKLVLILMVKNESKIIQRCMESVASLVDAFCISDTQSTDDTREIVHEFLKTHEGNLSVNEWKNFGHNRSLSFLNAQKYLKDILSWDLSKTYGLLLDADMVFVPGTLKEQVLTDIGYTVIQSNGSIDYPNCRLVRMDHPWKCTGVTHEYWDGPTAKLPKTVCHIQDLNDGGCKSDKFERDAKLLEKGLIDEPNNVRYMFYLAQTYSCMERHSDAISMYKRRIRAGGWEEENWYSHFMIGQCYYTLKNYPKFEEWMLKAHERRPNRAEPIYKLAKHFREIAQHYKAYHYVELGSKIALPDDSLFIERDVYGGLFDYERSILDYYVKSDKGEGLLSSVRCMLKSSINQQSVLSNLRFYTRSLGVVTALQLPSPFGEKYRPSAISIRKYPNANVRYINYWIENGDYKTPDGEPVQTQNAFVNLQTKEVIAIMDDTTVGIPKRDCHVRGLEDVRLYDGRFTATVAEYSERPMVLQGVYNYTMGTYDNCKLLPSPTGRDCEKNWLPFANTNDIIYDWHPFRVVGDNPVTYDTPPMFSLFRGSAPPVKQNNTWWVLVHIVEYSKPRTYYHCFVQLDEKYKPIRTSLPFVFRTPSIEYCVSFHFEDEDTIECFASFMDKDSSSVKISVSDITWMSI